MKITTLDEVVDKTWGKRGTLEREEMEAQLKEDLQAYHIGEAIKQARKEKNLTQEQLGELMGVKRAQISKIESGKNLSFSTISRVFRALDIHAELAFGDFSFSLW